MGRDFAFGDNRVKSCDCPAAAAGFRPDNGGHISHVADQYDSIVSTKVGVPEGVINESKAKEFWDKTLQSIRKKEEDEIAAGNEEAAEWDRKCVEAGEKVKEELDWN